MLVVRVIDRDGRAVPESAHTLSDKIFGTYGDSVNTASGFRHCSLGKMEMTYDYDGKVDTSVMSAPGVLEVRLNKSLPDLTQPQLVQVMVAAAQAKLGMRLKGPFHHVMFVNEKCYGMCGWAAYAYVGHWLSNYVGPNANYPAVVMHEVGHNLNFAHSGGMDGQTYTDHTCLMGNPLFEDNMVSMCFNPVKNFQLSMGENA